MVRQGKAIRLRTTIAGLPGQLETALNARRWRRVMDATLVDRAIANSLTLLVSGSSVTEGQSQHQQIEVQPTHQFGQVERLLEARARTGSTASLPPTSSIRTPSSCPCCVGEGCAVRQFFVKHATSSIRTPQLGSDSKSARPRQ